MKNHSRPVLFALSLMFSVSSISFANDQPDKQSKPDSNINIGGRSEKVRQAEADAEEAKALAEKAREETRLKEALMKQKLIESMFKAEMEAGIVKEAAKKARAEAELANANAERSEAQLREMRAKMDLKTLEATAPIECDNKLAVTKYQQMETQMKLHKIQREFEQSGMSPTR